MSCVDGCVFSVGRVGYVATAGKLYNDMHRGVPTYFE